MSELSEAELPAESEPFRWADIAATEPSIRVSDYAMRYYQIAERAGTEGSVRDAETATLLGHICSYSLRLDGRQPFVAWSETAAVPDDLTDDQIARLRTLWPQASNPALRARVADLAWTLGRDVAGARTAVEAYLELASGLSDAPIRSRQYIQLLERALQLAVSLGRKNNSSRDLAWAALERHIAARAPIEDRFITRDLVAMALRFGADRAQYGDVLKKIAQCAEADRDWHRAREYWSLAVMCAKRSRDEERRRDWARALAETYVQEAAADADRPHIGKLMAAGHIQHAIEVLRRSGKERERVAELHHLLIEYQQGSTDSFVPVSSGSHDIEHFGEQAEAVVTGKPLAEALLSLSSLAPFLNVEQLRAQVENDAEQYLGLALMPPVYFGDEGQVIARPGSVRSNDPDEREAALRAMMIRRGEMHFNAFGEMFVDPARRKVLLEHPVREHDLLTILAHNPLVAEGREGLWAQGLYAGFVGDMPTAVHLLIPQLEHAIRRLLMGSGAQVSGVDDAGVQMMFGLNTLLFNPKLKELVGADLTFTLQALLTDQVGPNLRNRMAHGLLTDADCYSYSAVYLWVIALRLCCLPLAAEPSRRETDAATEPRADEPS